MIAGVGRQEELKIVSFDCITLAGLENLRKKKDLDSKLMSCMLKHNNKVKRLTSTLKTLRQSNEMKEALIK